MSAKIKLCIDELYELQNNISDLISQYETNLYKSEYIEDKFTCYFYSNDDAVSHFATSIHQATIYTQRTIEILTDIEKSLDSIRHDYIEIEQETIASILENTELFL